MMLPKYSILGPMYQPISYSMMDLHYEVVRLYRWDIAKESRWTMYHCLN